jgi:hypothetical protein
VVQFASLFTRRADAGDAVEPNGPFGFSPKISTPVENTVEKRRLTAVVSQKTLIFCGFSRGEA